MAPDRYVNRIAVARVLIFVVSSCRHVFIGGIFHDYSLVHGVDFGFP